MIDRRSVTERVLVGGALVLAAVAGVTIAVLAVHGSRTPGGGPPTSPTASSPAPPPLSATLILPTTTVKAGSEIDGQIVVQNRTGHDLHLAGCHGIFEVLLTSSTYHPQASFLGCLQAITIPSGRTSYPAVVMASYSACGMQGASGTMPACPPTGAPPLPPGHYEARTYESGAAVPLPAPVEVTVTA